MGLENNQNLGQNLGQNMPNNINPQMAANDTAINSQNAAQIPDVNVQTGSGTGELIDDVRNGTYRDQNQPSNNNNSLDTAREAFMKMLDNNNNSDMNNDVGMHILEVETEPMQQDVNGNADASNVSDIPVSTIPQFDMNLMSNKIEEAVKNAVANGQLRDLSQNDMAQNISDMQDSSHISEDNAAIDNTAEDTEDAALDIDSPEFYEKFSNDPGQAILEVADALSNKKMKELTTKLQPVLEQSEKLQQQKNIQDAIKQFASNGHEDFADYKDDMINILKNGQFKMDDPSAYESAYSSAKINRLQALNDQLSQNQGKTLNDYFQDNDSILQMAQNDDVKKAVIEDYLQGLSKGGTPQLISGGVANTPTAMPKNKVSSIKEASNLFKQMM